MAVNQGARADGYAGLGAKGGGYEKGAGDSKSALHIDVGPGEPLGDDPKVETEGRGR